MVEKRFLHRDHKRIPEVVFDLNLVSGWIEVRNDGKIIFTIEFPESSRQLQRNGIQNARIYIGEGGADSLPAIVPATAGPQHAGLKPDNMKRT